MPHPPNPWHEVQDMPDKWIFFEHAFDEAYLNLPSFELFGHTFRLTKFMILELLAALLIMLIYIPLARYIASGQLPKGRTWNFFEALLVFVRDDIARPNLGGHGHPEEADEYLPFLWTLFLFILFSNLLGMIPLLGSPTASIYVTGGLAICSLVMLHGAAIAKQGPIQYVKSLWPHIDVPVGGPLFSALIFALEFLGTFIKSGVLALRLFANMLAGHLVLANVMLFIFTVGNAVGIGPLWGGVTIASVLAAVGISLLELFVCLLQAYVFTFLTALFMGMNLHPEH